MMKIRKYLVFLFLILSVVFNPKPFVKSVQDDISEKNCSHRSDCITLYLRLDNLKSYSVMQSDRNSLKNDTFREAITSELMISFYKLLLVRIRV